MTSVPVLPVPACEMHAEEGLKAVKYCRCDTASFIARPEPIRRGEKCEFCRGQGNYISPDLTSAPAGLTIPGNLIINDCPSLIALPENLTVERNLRIYHCPSLTTLSEGLVVEGDLSIDYCQSFTTLPENLTVEKDLDIGHCPSLTVLPEGLTVKGYLDIHHCPLWRGADR